MSPFVIPSGSNLPQNGSMALYYDQSTNVFNLVGVYSGNQLAVATVDVAQPNVADQLTNKSIYQFANSGGCCGVTPDIAIARQGNKNIVYTFIPDSGQTGTLYETDFTDSSNLTTFASRNLSFEMTGLVYDPTVNRSEERRVGKECRL